MRVWYDLDLLGETSFGPLLEQVLPELTFENFPTPASQIVGFFDPNFSHNRSHSVEMSGYIELTRSWMIYLVI
jgi:hypothetical protein